MVHYKVMHSLGPKKNQECYYEKFCNLLYEHTSSLFFFLMPSNFVIAAMGNEIHSISFNRQILEEIGLISCLSLWLHKEEKNEKNQCLKT